MSAKDLAQLWRLQQRIERYHQAQRRHEYYRENHALHEAIVAFSGNSILKEMHARLLVRVRRPRYMALLSQERWDESVREHAEVLAAFEAKDARRAGELMYRHIARTGEIVMATLAAEPS